MWPKPESAAGNPKNQRLTEVLVPWKPLRRFVVDTLIDTGGNAEYGAIKIKEEAIDALKMRQRTSLATFSSVRTKQESAETAWRRCYGTYTSRLACLATTKVFYKTLNGLCSERARALVWFCGDLSTTLRYLPLLVSFYFSVCDCVVRFLSYQSSLYDW